MYRANGSSHTRVRLVDADENEVEGGGGVVVMTIIHRDWFISGEVALPRWRKYAVAFDAIPNLRLAPSVCVSTSADKTRVA